MLQTHQSVAPRAAQVLLGGKGCVCLLVSFKEEEQVAQGGGR